MIRKTFLFFSLVLLTLSFFSCDGGSSSGSSSADAATGELDGAYSDSVPGSVNSVSVSAGDGEVVLSWNSVDGALSYNVYWSTSSGVSTSSGTKIAGAPTSFTHSGLTNNKTYYYVVTAVNLAGEGAASGQASGTPKASSVSNAILPDVPTGVTGTAGLNQAALSWSSVDDADYYNIYYSTSSGVTSGNGTKIAGISGTAYTHTGLANGATYYYVVTSVNGSNESDESAEIGVTPQVPAPSNLQVSSADSELTVSWDNVDGISTYNIYWSLTPTVTKSSNKISSVTSGYTHSGLTNGTTYYYAVTSNNAGGESALSSVISGSPAVVATSATMVWGHDGDFTLEGQNNGRVSRYGLYNPNDVISDNNGGFYVSDYSNNRVLHFSSGDLYADRVYGQGGSFVTNSANKDGISAESIYGPGGVAVTSSGVYIADTSNNRVLYYEGTSTTATRVYGQGGSFETNDANSGGRSAISLYQPIDVSADDYGVYIADTYNNRVLYYDGTSTTATRVYGQSGSFTTSSYATTSADSLYHPVAVEIESTGLYIADTYRNRVLFYDQSSDADNTTADLVYGQSSFTSSAYSTRSADSLYYPFDISVSDSGIYIADQNNNRVLYYEGTGASADTTADRVYGQSTFTTYSYGTTSTTLRTPQGVFADSNGVYVADCTNNRILFYPGTDTTATIVFGQVESDETLLTSSTSNYGGYTSESLSYAYDVAVDSNGGVYVADYYNNRVLYYPEGETAATRVYGQLNSFTSNDTDKDGISAATLDNPRSVAVDDSGVYIVDTDNHRVLYYEGTSTTATRVYGQSESITSSTANNGGISADSLCYPAAVALSNEGVYIVDAGNNRVLYFEGTSTTATRVYGQTVYTSSTSGCLATKLYLFYSAGAFGGDIALSDDGVYIADYYNNRVLFFEGESTTATRVYGQYVLTANTADYGGVHEESLDNPEGVAVDSNGGLYVSDSDNNRILYFAEDSTYATRVYGQQGSFTTATADKGGLSETSLQKPIGLCLDNNDVLYVADRTNNRVLKY
jgi:fibronectin type 3 domain-containing protein